MNLSPQEILWFWTTRKKPSTCLSSHVPLKTTLSKDTQRKATNMHTSHPTSMTTSAGWMLLKCHPKVISQQETTPHWQHCTNSSIQPWNSHFSKRTSLLSHWQHLTTSSTADLTLLLWNHHSSCPKSRPDLCIIFVKVAMWEPRHVQGQYTLCFNPLSCCPRPMAPLSISIWINMTSAAAVRLCHKIFQPFQISLAFMCHYDKPTYTGRHSLQICMINVW